MGNAEDRLRESHHDPSKKANGGTSGEKESCISKHKHSSVESGVTGCSGAIVCSSIDLIKLNHQEELLQAELSGRRPKEGRVSGNGAVEANDAEDYLWGKSPPPHINAIDRALEPAGKRKYPLCVAAVYALDRSRQAP
jgi:hypothetical protein